MSAEPVAPLPAGHGPSAADLRVQLLHRPDHPIISQDAWETLVGRSETASVFQTRAWHVAWWQVFGATLQGACLLVSRGDQPIGIAPLTVDPQRPGLVRFMGDGRADYCDVIAAAADKTAVLEQVLLTLSEIVHWDMLELNNVPAASHTATALRAVCEQYHLDFSMHEQYVCPTLKIRDHEVSARQIHGKASLRRPENGLQKAGRVEFVTERSAEPVLAQLDPFFDQHIGRWHQTPTPSLFLDPRNREFYRELTRRMADAGWLHFSRLGFEGQPVAFHFGFDHADVLTWYKPSFDIRHASRSPGMVLLRHLIGQALATNRRELDFTVGDEPFKRRFTNTIRRTVTLRAYRNPSAFLLQRSKRAVIDIAKRISSRADGRRQPVRQSGDIR